MNNYQQSGYYLVADGSNEYRSYEEELAYYTEDSDFEVDKDNWFDYQLMPTITQKQLWCMGKYGTVDGNPNYDPFDGNF